MLCGAFMARFWQDGYYYPAEVGDKIGRRRFGYPLVRFYKNWGQVLDTIKKGTLFIGVARAKKSSRGTYMLLLSFCYRGNGQHCLCGGLGGKVDFLPFTNGCL